jgi:hypothetical protein
MGIVNSLHDVSPEPATGQHIFRGSPNVPASFADIALLERSAVETVGTGTPATMSVKRSGGRRRTGYTHHGRHPTTGLPEPKCALAESADGAQARYGRIDSLNGRIKKHGAQQGLVVVDYYAALVAVRWEGLRF